MAVGVVMVVWIYCVSGGRAKSGTETDELVPGRG